MLQKLTIVPFNTSPFFFLRIDLSVTLQNKYLFNYTDNNRTRIDSSLVTKPLNVFLIAVILESVIMLQLHNTRLESDLPRAAALSKISIHETDVYLLVNVTSAAECG